MNKKQLIVGWVVSIFFINVTVFAQSTTTQVTLEDTSPKNRYWVADFDDDDAVEIFANKFKEAVVNKDRNTVASMILYPTKAILKNKAVIINNEKGFLELYDDIFDKDLNSKIANADTHNMFANYQGVMLGDGEVWFGSDGNNIKVIAVGVCRRYFTEYIK